MKLELDKARADGANKLCPPLSQYSSFADYNEKRNKALTDISVQLADLQAKTLEIAAKLKPNDLMLPQDIEQAHAYCVGFSDALQAIAAAAAALREGR